MATIARAMQVGVGGPKCRHKNRSDEFEGIPYEVAGAE